MSENQKLPTREEQLQDSLCRIKTEPHAVWAVRLAEAIASTNWVPRDWTGEAREWNQAKLSTNRLVLDELGEASTYLAGRLAENLTLWDAAANSTTL